MKTIDVLTQLEWGMKHFDGLSSSRSLPRRDIVREIHKGLVESLGMMPLCDGDGFLIVPERYRECFGLTEAGRKHLAEHERANV